MFYITDPEAFQRDLTIDKFITENIDCSLIYNKEMSQWASNVKLTLK